MRKKIDNRHCDNTSRTIKIKVKKEIKSLKRPKNDKNQPFYKKIFTMY